MPKTTIHTPSEIEVGKIYESTRHTHATYLGVGRPNDDSDEFVFKTLIVLEARCKADIGVIVVEPEKNPEFWAEGFSLIED